ncbi:MAG: hypothetical protein ACKVOW_13230 [Chitinophagaceae bacterium]
MKPLLIMLFTIAVLLSACSNTESNAIKSFIPGTYIRSAEHEFGAEHDTVIISLQNNSANEYKLVRRWRYERVLDGKPIAPEYKNTSTSAIFNAESKMLQETETANTYSFDPKQKAMFAGTTKYLKLK